MKSLSGGFNITNELYKRSRQPCNKIATCIRKFAEKKTAESSYVNKTVPLTGTVKSTYIVAFSFDGTLMASTHGDHHVRVTDVRTHECIMTLIGHPRTPWCVTFHPSSNEILASGCLGGEVRVWDLHGGSEVWISEHHSTIHSLSFHPLDQVLAIATGNQIFLWNWSQPRPFASVKTACLAERVRLIRFSTHGDFLLTGIANFPRNENDVDMSRSNSEGPFQRPTFSRRFFQFRDDDLDDFDSQRYPHIETPYTQTSEFRIRRTLARRDRLYMAEAALERASNQSREIHTLLSQADEAVSTVNTSNSINSREMLSQARNYAASVTLETVANRATDALVSGESHRAAGRDAMTHRQILESVLSSMQNETQSESRNNLSEPPQDLSILTQRRTNSVLHAAVRHRPFRQRINAYRSPDSRPERGNNRTSTALELRTILHPELNVPSTSNTNRDSNLPMQTSEASSSGSKSNEKSEAAGTSMRSSTECSHSSKTNHHSSHSSNTSTSGCIYGTSRDQQQRTKSASSQPSSFRQVCPHHENKAMMRRNIKERFRDHIRERNRAESRLQEQDGQRSNDSVGLSNARRIARRIQTPRPLTRCWSSRRKCSHYRGRLAAMSSDDTHREVRRSRVGVHRLSRGMERVRPTQQPLHRHYDVSIFDEQIGRPSRNVHAVVNRAIADAFNGRGETAVANNIRNITHRLQWWDFTRQELPDISNVNACVIVPHCKIHNDNSCDLSEDNQLLAAFVPSPRGFPDDGVVAIYSLKKHNFGDVLYTKSFGPNAICTSLSPSGDYVVVGLAAKRLHCWHQTSRKVMAQVFRVKEPYAGENSLVHVNSILHDGDIDQCHQVSVNVVKWIPCPGAGIAYGTNKGDLRICVASSPTIGEDQSNLTWNQSSNSNGDMYSRYSIDPAQRASLYNDISVIALGMQFPNRRNRTESGLARVARSTQTGEDDDDGVERQSMSTQTEQPVREASPQGDRGDGDREIDEDVGVSSVQGIVNGGEQEMEQPVIEAEVNEGNNQVVEEMESNESRDRETGETV